MKSDTHEDRKKLMEFLMAPGINWSRIKTMNIEKMNYFFKVGHNYMIYLFWTEREHNQSRLKNRHFLWFLSLDKNHIASKFNRNLEADQLILQLVISARKRTTLRNHMLYAHVTHVTSTTKTSWLRLIHQGFQ